MTHGFPPDIAVFQSLRHRRAGHGPFSKDGRSSRESKIGPVVLQQRENRVRSQNPGIRADGPWALVDQVEATEGEPRYLRGRGSE